MPINDWETQFNEWSRGDDFRNFIYNNTNNGSLGGGGGIQPPSINPVNEPENEEITMQQILSYLDNRLANNPDNVGYTPTGNYQGENYFPHINPNDDDYASKIRANIAEQEYHDYLQRFKPMEQELMWSVDNPLLKAIDQYRTTSNVHSAYLNTNAQKKRTMQRYGLQVDGTSVKNNVIARSAALAKARNETRRAGKQRDINIMGGGLNASASTRLTQEGGS
ncbi:hypothetical protein [Pleionea sp. CnH1-48]|uniref:hypothetical protein n=1 Tax=Pleionea sp. CnH1-48 TaxID=2954494 RepID=UPI002097E1D0|nr:hypothetical protein [Pleionea sp. CnH1-48]MCO7225934.1 hypothetical protein [Pleionea sp. CnH1-48]